MALRKRLARGFVVEIESAVANTWVQIGGLRNIDVGSSKNDADTTDFNSNGNEEHVPASRGKSLTIEAIFMEHDAVQAGPPAVAIGDRDPGQARCEVLDALVGDAGLANVRYKTPSLKTKTFLASVDVSGPGGGNNDPAAWRCAFTRSGATTSS